MKSLKLLLIAALFLTPLGLSPRTLHAEGTAQQLVLKKNSKIMIHNGVMKLAAQPQTIRNHSSYAALRGIAEIFGYALSYDVKTRESIAKSGTTELRFKQGSSVIKMNGKPVIGPGPAFVSNGFLMIPVRTWSNLAGAVITFNGPDTVVSWNAVPKADFTVSPKNIYAGQTYVTYTDRSAAPGGATIVDERWEGREEVFQEPGLHTITRYVMDSNGNWSEPFSVTIRVLPPNQPPVADFSTEKTVYRIGERIHYTDLSTDDENAIVSRKWEGHKPVFFEAGDKTVTLTVTDQHGESNSVTKTITVSSEVLYSKEEYGRLFTPVGDKYEMNGADVLTYQSVPYTYADDPSQMIRINSPESLSEEGLIYDTNLNAGKTRFLFHNMNAMERNIKLYLIATNNNGMTAKVGVGPFGIGGPDPYVTNTGKLSTSRYLQALTRASEPVWTSIRPGRTEVIFKELNAVPIKPYQVLSAYADIVTDRDIRVRVIAVDSTKHALSVLGMLPRLESNDAHVRGTFDSADRNIIISETLGEQAQRIVLGDRNVDRYLTGIDDMTGDLEVNLGNFGVLYRMKLRVAPNTVIGLNARGGHYTGAFTVNGKVVNVTDASILKNRDETAVLYRTGSAAENVTIDFTPASGSNLPIHLLFLPIPELRW